MGELSTTKSAFVIAIVVGCFAVLWPKIFHPMFFSRDFGGDSGSLDRPPQLNPDMIHPAMRERNRLYYGPDGQPLKRTIDKEIRPGPIPGMRPSMGGGPAIPAAVRNQGAMGMLMPIYTIGIVIFFLYTIMKLMSKKDPVVSAGKKYPKAYHDMDALRQADSSGRRMQREMYAESVTAPSPKKKVTDPGEVADLKQKLLEAEVAMKRMLQQMEALKRQASEATSEATEDVAKKDEVEDEVEAEAAGEEEAIRSRPQSPTSKSRPQSPNREDVHERVKTPIPSGLE